MLNFLRVYNTIEWKIKIGLKQLFILCFKRSSIIPNHIYIKFLYFFVFLKWPDTKNPKTFNENILKLKLNEESITYYKYTDKVLVRDYVQAKVGEKYLNKIYGVYDNFSDINFEVLPQKFVIKTNHWSGYNYFFDKSKTNNLKRLNYYFTKSLKSNYYFEGRELNYKNIQPKLIVERLLEPEGDKLFEFKVFCFYGIHKFFGLNLYFAGKRFSNIYYRNKIPVELIYGYPNFDLDALPNKTDEILDLAEKLSYPFAFVRVDVYQVNNQIVFSELTFHPGGGLIPFKPASYDVLFGKYFSM